MYVCRPQYSADYGDYISFASHMRAKADERGVDLLLIDTGDRIEGNGLYDASSPKGKYTTDIIREQSIDIICTGNHELYVASSVEREHDVTVPNFKESYIASNLDYIEPQTGNQIPQAQRYRKFQTKNQNLTVVAFGFLFDFDRAANNSVVLPVEETVKEDWFQKAIREKPDIFVVIGHVGLRMKEFEVIFKTIRDQNWFTPIAFFGGHAHVRDARKFDDKAFAIASGRYMETIGWMSVGGVKKRQNEQDQVSADTSVSFSRRYIDNNLFGLWHHTGLNETTFPTEHGRNVSKYIAASREAMDLDHTFGCAPRDLWMSRAEYPSDKSIYTWLEKKVIPDVVVNKERAKVPRLAITNTGLVRFDIFTGAFTTDSTFILSPFVSKWNFIADVPYEVAKKVIGLINRSGQVAALSSDPALDVRWLLSPEQAALSMKPRFEEHQKHAPLHLAGDDGQKRLGGGDNDSNDDDESSALIPGYTTKDDVGDDGDDTVHKPLRFYSVPPCIQTSIDFPEEGDPKKVDLVFIDYVQPWIIEALRYIGGDYNTHDVKPWSNETMTELIASWVAKNWKGDC
jgi:hypothetical protein